jgi:FlaA1/EpsC-like NDP-sugar epimerase
LNNKEKKNNRSLLLPLGSTPRWVVMLIDLFLFLIALSMAYLMRFEVYRNFSIVEYEWNYLSKALPFLILIKFTVFYYFKIHRGVIRFTSFEDVRRIFFAILTTSILFAIGGLIRHYFFDGRYLIPTSVLFMEFFTSLLLTIGIRLLVKVYYTESSKNKEKSQKHVLIFGAGVSGLITKRTIEKDTQLRYRIIGFIEDNPKMVGNRLEGSTIYAGVDLEKILEEQEIDEFIVAIQSPEKKNLSSKIDLCLKYGVEVKSVPNFKSWINGEFSIRQIKKVRIEDLLGRKPIILEEDKVREQLKDEIVLVTGAAGSIGSGLVRQIVAFEPKKIVILDQAESDLYDFSNELIANDQFKNVEVVVGDIRNKARMETLFKTFQPKYVFHAAAYKHVPLMEDNPYEAVLTNVNGTRNMIDLSDQYGVKKFIMVSTDKAVNPTNIMGATKRVAELYAQFKNAISSTQYVTTRFGNVLGSNGSVIPLFKNQIEQGGPITVTHPEVTRYFMTIPEACQLVLDASSMGKGGEVFVFDMGDSVKIIDLARKMINLSGLKEGVDIEIKYTGLRPGEKLYEELLANDENTLETHHPQILKAKLAPIGEEFNEKINLLCDVKFDVDNFELVQRLKNIVPEFKSNNSIYTKLDK